MNSYENYEGVEQVAKWLFFCALMIAIMVVIGGITRLTESGVSITEWNLMTGIIPPLNPQDWQELYSKYQNTPQFKEINSHMTVDEFQTIFWWEWIHRLWGRLIGVVFVVPLLWFAWKNRLPSTLFLSLAVLLILGSMQGYLGWWMVQSGIKDQPWVSPVRLTVHLGFAILLFGLVMWIGLSLIRGVSPTKFYSKSRSALVSKILLLMIFGTILLGGMTAGSRAGLVYNQFPLMGDGFIPSDYWLATLSFWDNGLINPVAIQFHHRIAAEITGLLIIGLAVTVYYKRHHQKIIRRAALVFLLAALLQIGLGIATLVMAVPIVLAALHQFGAVFLFGSGVVLTHLLSTGEPREDKRFISEKNKQPARHGATRQIDQ
ncbi:MAG: COX15/CtaA family protein [Candidatus Pacebacteria bacterium]|nr:COX15/CtaA family protein [Candidatus Paceibacterota bacterium]